MSRWTRKLKSMSALAENRLAWAIIDRSRATLRGAERVPREGGALLVGERALAATDALPLRALLSVCCGRTPRFVVAPGIVRRALRPLLERAGVVPGSTPEVMGLVEQGELVCFVPDTPSQAAEEAARAATEARVPVLRFIGRRTDPDASLEIELYDFPA